MKICKVVLGIALSLTVITGSRHVFAQERPKPEMKCEQRFAKMDTDKDGVLTKEEFCSKGMKQKKGRQF